MPVFFYENKDAVPEDVREFAAEVKDGDNKGKFSVNLVPRPKLEEFRGNNEKLSKTIESRDALISQFVELTGQKAEEFKMDDFKKALADLREIEKGVKDGKLTKSDDIEAEVKKRLSLSTEKQENALRENATVVATLKQQLEQANRRLDLTVIDRAVAEAMRNEKLGVHPTAAGDITRQAYEVFQLEKDRSLRPVDHNGATMFGEDGSSHMTVDEWIDNVLRKKQPHYFKQSQGGGAGGGDGKAEYGGHTYEDFMKLPAETRLRIANKATTKLR